jgi:hypothetical protein
VKKESYKDKKSFIHTEKKLDKLNYRLIIGLAITGIAYYYFIEPKIIGHDNRYIIYIVTLPTIIGMLILGIYRRHFLINRFSKNKGIILWTFMTLFYFTQGVLFSYLSFGQVAKISWDILNNKTAEQNSEEFFECKITGFCTGKRPSIDFKFKNRYERIRVNYSTIKEYENKNEDDYILKINATKGLWNYYKLNEWSLEYK